MKKILLLIILLLVPFIVFAKEDVEINSVELIDKSFYVEEVSEPEFNGLSLSFKLKFIDIDDYAKYKVIIRNNSDVSYEVDNQTTFNDGDFVKYEYEIEDNKKEIKPKSDIIMYVTITYYKKINDDMFVNNEYRENNNASIELIDKVEENNINNEEVKEVELSKDIIVNPKTSDIIYLLVAIVILSILLIIFVKSSKVKMFIISLLFLVPITIYGLEKLRIEIDTDILINKVEEKMLFHECEFGERLFEVGETFIDVNNNNNRFFDFLFRDDNELYLEFHYFEDLDCYSQVHWPFVETPTRSYYNYADSDAIETLYSCKIAKTERVNKEDKIKPAYRGYYTVEGGYLC